MEYLFLEKLIVAHCVSKFPAFYAAQKFNTGSPLDTIPTYFP
jgi:hypothetical protein